MIMLAVTGSSGLFGVRSIGFTIESEMLPVSDERYGTQSYRGQPYVNGILVVEEALTAVALVTADAADRIFNVWAPPVGNDTITVKGFRALGYQAMIPDGSQSGPVPGYAVRFDGVLDNTINAGTAVTHT